MGEASSASAPTSAGRKGRVWSGRDACRRHDPSENETQCETPKNLMFCARFVHSTCYHVESISPKRTSARFPGTQQVFSRVGAHSLLATPHLTLGLGVILHSTIGDRVRPSGEPGGARVPASFPVPHPAKAEAEEGPTTSLWAIRIAIPPHEHFPLSPQPHVLSL